MKRTIYFAAALLALAACRQQPVPTASVECGPYTVDVIADGVYHIQDFCTENPAGETFADDGTLTHFNNCSDMYLICGSQKALLIDLSNRLDVEGAADSLRALVSERTGGLPLTITFTHNHGDHTGMLGAYVSLPARGSDEKASLLADNVDFALPRTDFEAFEPLFEEIPHSYYDDCVFDLGGRSVETFQVPGHTAGSVVFLLRGEDILFAGDAVGSGHGVWIFNSEAFGQYFHAVPQLISFIEDPARGIDTAGLKIYGGHYWQRDWLEMGELSDAAAAALRGESADSTAVCKKGSGTLAPGDELGYGYIKDMQALLDDMSRGEAYAEPSGLGRPGLDTYFRHGLAIITWSADQASAFFAPAE